MGTSTEWDGLLETPKERFVKHSERHLDVSWSDAQLALATNVVDSTEAHIRASLGRVGLDVLIEQVYCFKRIGHRKPSAEFFAFILRDLGVDPDRVVMVGDDFENDIVGANSVGIYGVWLSHTGENRRGALHRTIHNLWGLPSVLEEIVQAV